MALDACCEFINTTCAEARCRAFTHGVKGHRIDPSCWTIELFLIPASASRVSVHGVIGCWIDPSRWTIELFLIPASAGRVSVHGVIG